MEKLKEHIKEIEKRAELHLKDERGGWGEGFYRGKIHVSQDILCELEKINIIDKPLIIQYESLRNEAKKLKEISLRVQQCFDRSYRPKRILDMELFLECQYKTIIRGISLFPRLMLMLLGIYKQRTYKLYKRKRKEREIQLNINKLKEDVIKNRNFKKSQFGKIKDNKITK